MYSDSGEGFLAWRGTLLGRLNCIIVPDSENISYDSARFLNLWSPGQYIFPGVISLSGVQLGMAITITCALCFLLGLLGWIKVSKKFLPNSKAIIAIVFAVGLFRYSTLPFGIYNGGEVLLQAVTPWIILGTFKVPYLSAMRAGLLAGGLVFIAFLTKITGLIVVGSGLIAGGMVALRRMRRVTPGMVGGSVSALIVVGAIYELFLSKGSTQLSRAWAPGQGGINWSFPLDGVIFSVAGPWVAGISWTDLLAWIFLHPGRELVQSWVALVWFMVPPALIVASLVVLWEAKTESESDLRTFTVWFYGVTVATFVLLYILRADVGYEERHFRSAGTLLFVAALIGSIGPKVPDWLRYTFVALVVSMALYGLASFSSRALAAADGHAIDLTSWTNQPLVDQSAIRYLQAEYLHEGREALFVIPSPDIVVTLPLEARVIALHIDFQRETEIAALRYRGRVPGHIFILIQNRIADSPKGEALLRAFVDYNPQTWTRKTFSTSTVFIQ